MQKISEVADGPSCDSKTLSEISGLVKTIETFDFIVSLANWNTVLNTVNRASVILQAPKLNMTHAMDVVSAVKDTVCEYRQTGLVTAIQEGKALAEKMDTEPTFSEHRTRRSKRLPGELSADEPLNGWQKFEVNFFNCLLDTILMETEERFSFFQELDERFGFLFEIKKCGNNTNLKQASNNLACFLGDIKALSCLRSYFSLSPASK